METWIRDSKDYHFIAVTGMHGVTEAQRDASFKTILTAADLVVPDGMPLVWLGRYRGHDLRRRVYGPELMETFCQSTGSKFRHFLYGGRPEVLARLSEHLREKYGVNVVGAYAPPFRPLTACEDKEIVARIHAANPDILWVGLSTPKQERWMNEHRRNLRVPCVVGVGAAFDINSGSIGQAPGWMREHGLEWFYRLIREPRRLWRRYIVYGSQFVYNVTLEVLSIRHFD